MEKLRKPITLAEFLGWEEGKLYKVKGEEYKVVDNNLYLYLNYDNEFELSPLCFCNYDISILRQAKKIEPKKFYAKIKGTELLGAQTDLKCFYFTPIQNGIVLCDKLHKKEQQIRTKEEWKDLGITEENADFEEAK